MHSPPHVHTHTHWSARSHTHPWAHTCSWGLLSLAQHSGAPAPPGWRWPTEGPGAILAPGPHSGLSPRSGRLACQGLLAPRRTPPPPSPRPGAGAGPSPRRRGHGATWTGVGGCGSGPWGVFLLTPVPPAVSDQGGDTCSVDVGLFTPRGTPTGSVLAHRPRLGQDHRCRANLPPPGFSLIPVGITYTLRARWSDRCGVGGGGRRGGGGQSPRGEEEG